jgi:ubiquinone/menaquinone biosynthesis C-methylase UbiE
MVDQLFADAYLASLYDVWHPRETRVDYDFYLLRIMSSTAVLDVGCGTGTLLRDARRRGHSGRLCGLDPASGMIDRARESEDIEWVLGDLQSASWSAAFDLVVMTGHAFQAIVLDEDIRASLASVRRALVPGGTFAFETRNPAARAWERWRPENATTITAPDGTPVKITTAVLAPFDGRTISFTHTFAGAHASLPQVSQSTLRFLDVDTLEALLREAGLSAEHWFGDFDGARLSADSPEIIVIARALKAQPSYQTT